VRLPAGYGFTAQIEAIFQARARPLVAKSASSLDQLRTNAALDSVATSSVPIFRWHGSALHVAFASEPLGTPQRAHGFRWPARDMDVVTSLGYARISVSGALRPPGIS